MQSIENLMEIDGIKIGSGEQPFVIAELSGNHSQSLILAKKMIDAAAASGVHAIKLQTYTADTMTLDCESSDFQIQEKDSLWKNKTLHQLYQEAYTPWEWHEELFHHAKEKGMLAFSSPFDKSAVEFLEALNVPCYKIASFENNDIPLIRSIAETGKPVIMSTGMAAKEELDEAVETLRTYGCGQFILLKCTSAYPALASDANLRTIADLKDRYQCEVGVSDHTLGIGVSLAAVALGASVIEKHFVLSREEGGVDSAFSLEPSEFKMLVEESFNVAHSLGKVIYGGSENELASKTYRRSIYVSENIKKGAEITSDNIRVIRPGYGLAPKYYDQVLGTTAAIHLKKGTALSWNNLITND